MAARAGGTMSSQRSQGPASAQLPVIDISCGRLTAATATASVVLSPAIMRRDHPAAAQLPPQLLRNPGTGRLLCGREVAAIAANSDGAVVAEPWAYIDYPVISVAGSAISFPEAARTTLVHAAEWFANTRNDAVDSIRLVVPTYWGQRRRDRAVDICSSMQITSHPVRAALLIADALTSSYARWNIVVELAARGASIALVERNDQTLSLISTRFVVAVDPDDDVPGGGYMDRILGAVDQVRAAHRPTRTGSLEVLVSGRGAHELVERFDQRRLLSFAVPAEAAAERAALLAAHREISSKREPQSEPVTSL